MKSNALRYSHAWDGIRLDPEGRCVHYSQYEALERYVERLKAQIWAMELRAIQIAWARGT